MLRNWKREFLEKAGTVFEDPKKAEKQSKRKEVCLKNEIERILKTIGQLTLEAEHRRYFQFIIQRWCSGLGRGRLSDYL